MRFNKLHGVPTYLFTFSTCSMLFECGIHDEDGSNLVGSHHYVVATARDGRRFLRSVGSSSWLCTYNDDDEPVYDRTADPRELDKAAAALAAKLNKMSCPRLDEHAWFHTDAAYGSEEFSRNEEFSQLVYG